VNTPFCFDLDGVITAQELLPLIARALGCEQEIAELTQAAITGVLPFHNALRLRCEMLSAIPIPQVREIVGQVLLHQQIVTFITTHREQCFVITGNLDVWVEI